MKEKAFTKKIQQNLRGFKVYSFEVTGGAIPDLHLKSLDPAHPYSFWCEAKVFHSGTKKVVFQQGQTKWLREYASPGRSNVIILCAETHNVWLYEGKDAPLIERMKFDKDLGSLSSAKPIHKNNLKNKSVWTDLEVAMRVWLGGAED